MEWNDGLGEDGTRILLPRCGITYKQIIDAAAEKKTLPATAKRHGVGEATMRTCVFLYGLTHCFEGRTGPRAGRMGSAARVREVMKGVGMIDIGGGLRVNEETRCRGCGAGTDSLRYYQGWLGFQAIECKVCGHQKDLNLSHGQSDTFFTQSSCDRCGGSLERGRTMSWFTPDCLCSDCHGKERELRVELRRVGQDDTKLEGCGHVPAIPVN